MFFFGDTLRLEISRTCGCEKVGRDELKKEKAMEVENQRQPFLLQYLGVYPQRKGLRGFCKTFRRKKVFERMGKKKPQRFLHEVRGF